VALLLLSRIGPNASYVRWVLPAVVILGVGLSLTVAPLTATALGSVDERYAGVASGVNNAVARAAGLLSVAVLPLAAGLGTGSLTDPATLAPTYRMSMHLCVGLLLAGGVIAAIAIPTRLAAPERPAEAPAEPAPTSPARFHCAVAGTPLHPHDRHSGAVVSGRG
jgi:hypothetical protein